VEIINIPFRWYVPTFTYCDWSIIGWIDIMIARWRHTGYVKNEFITTRYIYRKKNESSEK
jgi:hypothetical protein